jgi:DNA-binding HxlR family transcriptional regulator
LGNSNRWSKEDIEYIRKAIRIFSQKWTTEIAVLFITKEKAMGFNELVRELNGISAAVLSSRLRMLQGLGYIKREVKAGPPTRTSYSLTRKGEAFADTMDIIAAHRNL